MGKSEESMFLLGVVHSSRSDLHRAVEHVVVYNNQFKYSTHTDAVVLQAEPFAITDYLTQLVEESIHIPYNVKYLQYIINSSSHRVRICITRKIK